MRLLYYLTEIINAKNNIKICFLNKAKYAEVIRLIWIIAMNPSRLKIGDFFI